MIEALVATAVVATAVGTLAALVSWSVGTVLDARDRSLTALLAWSKLEVLRAAPTPPAVSPDGTLEADVPGFHERLDGGGRVAGVDAGYSGTVFVRRWRVRPLEAPGHAVAITVLVSRCGAAGGPQGCVPRHGSARVSAVRSDRAW